MQARMPRGTPIVPPRQREGMCEDHRKLVKLLPCLACGKWPPSDPHHLQRGLPAGQRGTARKAADKYLIPLCRTPHAATPGCHVEAEAGGDDEAWLAARGVDGRAIAAALWRERGNIEAMHRIIIRSLGARGIYVS